MPSKGETTNSGCSFSRPAEKIWLSHGNINFLEFWVMQISGCRVHVVISVLIKIDHFSYSLSTKITPNLMPIWVSIRTTHIANSVYHRDLMSNWKHKKNHHPACFVPWALANCSHGIFHRYFASYTPQELIQTLYQTIKKMNNSCCRD